MGEWSSYTTQGLRFRLNSPERRCPLEDEELSLAAQLVGGRQRTGTSALAGSDEAARAPKVRRVTLDTFYELSSSSSGTDVPGGTGQAAGALRSRGVRAVIAGTSAERL